MYSEKIDTILAGLDAYNKDLRSIARNIIKDIMSYAKTEGANTINVAYYTDSEITGYTFLGVRGDGYGAGLFISDIYSISGKLWEDPWFALVDEDGDSFEDRTLEDFDTTELTYIVRMLNDILDVVREDDDVHTQYDWA